jgi:hypothetical protein
MDLKSPLKRQRPMDYILEDLKQAIEEAKAIVKAAVENKEYKSCDVLVNINGEVIRAGDFPKPNIDKYTKHPDNSTLVFISNVNISPLYDKSSGGAYKDWRRIGEEYEPANRYGKDFENIHDNYDLKNVLTRWLKKNRDKVHHVNLPMTRRIRMDRLLMEDCMKKIELVTLREDNPSEDALKGALAAVDGIMAQMRAVHKELTLQAEKDIPHFNARIKKR